MSISDWAGLILTALSIIAITVGGIRWFIQAEMKNLSNELKSDLSELKPNHGSSMKDQVSRMEADILDLKNQNHKGEEYHEKLDNKIDELTKLFVEYVSRQK